MESKHICNVCGKSITEFNHIGLNKKLLGRSIEKFFCMGCLANFLEVTVLDLEIKITEFITQDCALFRKDEEIPYGREVWEKIKYKFEGCGDNVYFRALTAFNKINDPKYTKIFCAVSGGADSDIMIDWFVAMDYNKKIIFVFFDTGLEYEATKQHLKETEEIYGIEILVIKATKPIPTSCKEDGQPFLSKQISEYISRLQKHNFQWEDEEFDVLYKRYPNCKIALCWWCNTAGEGSSFNINKHKLLKEFMVSYPPLFKISNKCCSGAKKKPSQNELKRGKYEMCMVGVRRAENGARSQAYKNCFTCNEEKSYDDFRPLFFITDEDKQAYKSHNSLSYSDCYEIWGMKRTGCAGCPFGSRFEEELKLIQQHEPKLFKACNNIFGNSYDYTRKYRIFKESNHEERTAVVEEWKNDDTENQCINQSLFDIPFGSEIEEEEINAVLNDEYEIDTREKDIVFENDDYILYQYKE